MMLVDALQLLQPLQQAWLPLALALLLQFPDGFLDLASQRPLQQLHHLPLQGLAAADGALLDLRWMRESLGGASLHGHKKLGHL